MLLLFASFLAFDWSKEYREALQARNYVRAEIVLLRELKQGPESAPLLSALGGVHFQAGNFERAAAFFEKANRIQPLDESNRFTLAMAYAALNQRERAREHLLGLPETAMTLYWQGRLEFAGADYKRAIPRFEKAIELNPSFVRAHDSLGLTYEAVSNFDEAVRYYRLAMEKNAECSPWPAHNLGKLLLTLGRTDEAESVLTTCVSCAPDFAPGHYQLGRLREKQGRVNEAMASLRTATQKKPGSPDAWFALARVYQKLGHPFDQAEALANLARVQQNGIARDPSLLDQAIQTYRGLLQLSPASTDALYQLAFLLMIKGDHVEALAQVAKLPQSHLQRPQALAVSLVCHAATGREETPALLESLLAHKNLAEADALGILAALYASGQDKVALPLLERLLERGLAGSAGLKELAALYEKLDRHADARRTLEEAVKRSGA
ncbi:MAG: tetratricopeptide repeat protein, partial [Pirellulaceae bacterium]|nr:tetratricopeptide repeat protein [Pirellulaceae bacterium]